jgi:glutathione synthase/RimK-type ligase-like ATP-grasp enzyme
MPDCTLVTCAMVRELDPDDRLLLHELRRRGLKVSIEVWDDPRADWSASTLSIVRSTWDYHRRYRDFMAWIAKASALTIIKNEPSLLGWNARKSYLRDLECLGVPVVPTVWVGRAERSCLAVIAAERGWRDLVLKPGTGAASHDVTLVARGADSYATGQTRLDHLTLTDEALVQPYLESVVDYGERALMFFGGRYSHAVVKKPFDGDFAISDEPSTRTQATAREIEVATQAVEAAPAPTLYARVDLLRDARGEPVVSELELIEPALYLAVHDAARVALADAVEHELAIHGRATSFP